jgi:hypothetical protein
MISDVLYLLNFIIFIAEVYEYPDPYTCCPQDMLSKLAQLAKLQSETVEWEKKRRFTKRKPLNNGLVQSKDSA